MSDSRLEKFIYAICSMDVSDLPVPLSRIEKLWNCLITGETPDFEPLSRNEKYLMAMLDRYDISNLPAPMSRGEKLLYKIAVGETDLSDVPGYLSRYEELLKYLIENGGIGGGDFEDDFEYVLYTLNQSLHTLYLTAEKPVKKAIVYGDTLVNTLQESSSLSVTPMGEAIDTQQATITGTANGVIKSAILSGQTLVNLIDFNEINRVEGEASYEDGVITYNANYEWTGITFNLPTVKNSTVYTVVIDVLKNTLSSNEYQALGCFSGLTNIFNKGFGIHKFTITSWDDVTPKMSIVWKLQNAVASGVFKFKLMIIEGDHTNEDIPYFEGMQSVKMPVLKTTGKNVFSEDNSMELGAWHKEGTPFETSSEIRCKNPFTPLPSGLKNGDVISIVLSDTSINSNTNMHVYDENKTKITTIGYDISPYIEGTNFINGVSTVTIHNASKCKYFSFRAVSTNTECKFAIMVNTSAPYEPYKSNILTVNEPIELRGIGEGSNRVEDELNCLTGEVVERIEEVVLDGSENWRISGSTRPNHLRLYLFTTRFKEYQNVINDKFADNGDIKNRDIEGIYMSNSIDIQVEHSRLSEVSVDGFKNWLRENNIKVQVILSQESVKTVDLTVVDQDGNTVPHLQAFNETTHISTSSEGLIPNVVIPATVSYPSIIKPSTLYTVKLKRSVTSGTLMINVGGTEQAVTSDCFTMTTPSTLTSQDVIFSGKGNVISEVTVAEGNQTSKEYGYFEGMQSVKMPVLKTTGKNIFSPTKMIINDGATYGYYKHKDDESVRCTLSISDKDTSVDISGIYFGMSKSGKNANDGIEWLISNGSVTQPNTLSFTTNRNFISIYPNNTETLNKLTKRFNIQLEYGEVKTTYEPYKSNILTVNEPIELHGIGEGSSRVEDELDCLTGEVTERIGEVVLDGSENWIKPSNQPTNTVRFLLTDFPNNRNTKIKSNFKVKKNAMNDEIGIWCDVNTILNLDTSVDTVDSLKVFLSKNPIKLQYSLATESIKTVDLTVVDQDNQPTELGTFENVTNVSLEVENLIPEVEMEVATNLLEDTVFNLTDAFNTLYPTAAKPVKSAILKGNTLVNIFNNSLLFGGHSYILNSDGSITMNATGKYTECNFKLSSYIGKTVTIFIIFDENTIDVEGYNLQLPIFGYSNFSRKENRYLKKYVGVVEDGYLRFGLSPNATSGSIKFKFMAIEGNFLNQDIPYFEGMQSVKMPVLTTTGKNLLNMNNITLGSYVSGGGVYGNEVSFDNDAKRAYITIPVKPNTKYKYKSNNIYGYLRCMKNLTVEAGRVSGNSLTHTITTTEETNYISINLRHTDETKQLTREMIDGAEIMFVEGEDASSYEPYKTNILSTPEDLELRGIGEGSNRVKDELDCLTGEVTERIGVGNIENFKNVQYSNALFDGYYSSIIDLYNKKQDSVISTNLVPTNEFGNCDYGIYNNPGNVVLFKKGATLDEMKELINQLEIQYELEQKSIKTVDLTVQDQNGNETKLGTFDDTTHVLLNSEGLVPEATLTVRTKIPSASSTSLLMDDISTEQQQLETMVDEQSNNVDATMIATTEIYEETL